MRVRPVPAAWGHAVSPCQRCLLTPRRWSYSQARSSIPGGRCSQGGVKVPTGGKGDVAQARERLPQPLRKGQQIRCDSEADGQSPDERERLRWLRALAWGCLVPCALILVLKEENHESD